MTTTHSPSITRPRSGAEFCKCPIVLFPSVEMTNSNSEPTRQQMRWRQCTQIKLDSTRSDSRLPTPSHLTGKMRYRILKCQMGIGQRDTLHFRGGFNDKHTLWNGRLSENQYTLKFPYSQFLTTNSAIGIPECFVCSGMLSVVAMFRNDSREISQKKYIRYIRMFTLCKHRWIPVGSDGT